MVDTDPRWVSFDGDSKTVMKSDTCEDTTRITERLGRTRTGARRASLRPRPRTGRAQLVTAAQAARKRVGTPTHVGVGPEAERPHLQVRCAPPPMPGGELERGTPLAQVSLAVVPRNGKRTASEERAT